MPSRVHHPLAAQGRNPLILDVRLASAGERIVNLRLPVRPRVMPLSQPMMTAPPMVLSQPPPVQTSRLGRQVGSWAITIAMVLGIVVGVPKLLSWSLKTPFPMAAITSGSMWPDLKIGDLVFIQGITKEQIKIGDIIVFRNEENNTFTIHRVVKLGTDTLTTKGDANFKEDVPVKYSAVVGRTLNLVKNKPFHFPYLGSVTVFASNLRSP